MCFSPPSFPDLPPPPPPVAEDPKANAELQKNLQRERKRLAAAVGREDTVLTGGLFNTTARTARKSLLGGG